MPKLGRSLVLAGFTGIAAVASAAAQTVRGQVVEATSGGVVSDGFVVLVGMDGREMGRTLSDGQGRFTIRAPAAGRYRLRSERIGFRVTVSDPIDLADGQTVDHRLTVTAVPIRLDEVRVVADEQCRVRPEEGRATAVVWEEARKALAAVAWSQRQQLLRVTVRTYTREVTPALTVKAESSQTKSGFSSRPFRARPASDLAANGYVQESPGDGAFFFYAPDAEVLFSDEFLNTHCLRVTPGGTEHAGSVGLAFEPASKRPVAEIQGTMWLDEKSAELETVEFRYVNTRLPGTSDLMGGRVDFQQLVNGVWVVDHWFIRMPVFGLSAEGGPEPLSLTPGGRRIITGGSQRRVEVASFREEGGEVLDVFDRDGGRLAGTSGATLSGWVFDSTRMVPLIDATVRLVGTDQAVQTGPGGRFRVDRLPQGEYDLEFFHRDFPVWGVLRTGVHVSLQRGSVTETRLAVPPAERLAATLCPDASADSGFAVVGGRVTDAERGAPIPRAGVQVTWKTYGVSGGGGGQNRPAVLTESEGFETTADSAGTFRVCRVPANHPLAVQAVAGRTVGTPLELRLTAGEVRDVTLTLPRR